MKICALSDLHGDLIEVKPCELLLICGDNVPLNIQSNSKKTKKWYNTTFRTWASLQPCNKVLFIAGNHDIYLQGKRIIYESLFPYDDKITYLCNTEYTHTYEGKEYKIFGTPYCKNFGNWAFMYSDPDLEVIYKEIPKDLDILITHDQPYEYGDILLQEDCEWADGKHIGSIPLLNAIKEKQPKYQFNGHLHSCEKEEIMIGNTKHYNVSIKDEKYNMVYKPLYLDI